MRRRRLQRQPTHVGGAAVDGGESLALPELLRRMRTDAHTGLDPDEARARLLRDGPNELPASAGAVGWRLLWDQVRSFMTLLLLGAGALAWGLGEVADALAILAIVVLNVLLGFVQEHRAEQAIRALAQWRAPKARVVRGGQVVEVPAGELVVGDLLLVEAGDRIPADARLLEAYALQVEESALSGESAPVPKVVVPMPAPDETGPGRAGHVLFAGTTAVAGSGRAVVIRTGAHSELGRIAAMVSEAPRPDSPLQHALDQLARRLVAVCVLAVTAVFAVGVAQGQPWYGMLLVSISLAVAAIPEGLPAAITAALALGVQRMSRRRAVVRQLSAIETLGCATVICSDKTGTLTLNEMTVVRIEGPWGAVEISGQGFSPSGGFFADGQAVDPLGRPVLARLLRAGVLCGHGDVAHRSGRWVPVGDPTEAALVCAARKAGLEPSRLRGRYRVLAEAPFEAGRRRMSVGVASEVPGVAEVVAKGAPDAILAACARWQGPTGEQRMGRAERARIVQRAERLAADGLRVLAVAARRAAVTDLPDPQSSPEVLAAALERDLTFLGLVALRDPPRPDVAAAIERARRAHVRTVMVTGDHPATARAVAAAIGLAGEDEPVLTGREMARMSDEELEGQLGHCRLFARVPPDQKRRLVQLLRQEGHVVAMTGDGINDAPALKEADIGVAMGIAGTDVARQAASLVLLDDNYATIVDAIEEGRAIYDNIRRFVRYLLACNTGEMLTMLGASLLGLPVPLTALQILWVNLVTDGLPALALGMLPPARGVMQRPPRSRQEGLLARGAGEEIVAQGTVIGMSTLLVFAATLALGGSQAQARTAAFASLVLLQLVYALKMGYDAGRHGLPPPILAGSVLISTGLLGAVVAWPALQPLFGTTPLPAGVWALVAAGSVGVAAMQSLGDWGGARASRLVAKLMPALSRGRAS